VRSPHQCDRCLRGRAALCQLNVEGAGRGAHGGAPDGGGPRPAASPFCAGGDDLPAGPRPRRPARRRGRGLPAAAAPGMGPDNLNLARPGAGPRPSRTIGLPARCSAPCRVPHWSHLAAGAAASARPAARDSALMVQRAHRTKNSTGRSSCSVAPKTRAPCQCQCHRIASPGTSSKPQRSESGSSSCEPGIALALVVRGSPCHAAAFDISLPVVERSFAPAEIVTPCSMPLSKRSHSSQSKCGIRPICLVDSAESEPRDAEAAADAVSSQCLRQLYTRL
jgi:hypothetical protein